MKYSRQEKGFTSGPACVKMILSDIDISEDEISLQLNTCVKKGTNPNNIRIFLENKGYETLINYNQSYFKNDILLNDEFQKIYEEFFYQKFLLFLANLDKLNIIFVVSVNDTPHYIILNKFENGIFYFFDPFLGEINIKFNDFYNNTNEYYMWGISKDFTDKFYTENNLSFLYNKCYITCLK